MKDFLTGLKGKLSVAVGERIERHRPGATAELDAVRREMARHTAEFQQTLNDKAADAKAFAQRVATDELTQRAISRVSDGIDLAKEGLTAAALSVVSTVTAKGSSGESGPLADSGAEHEKLSATIEKLDGRDKVGVSAEVLGTAGGAAAGVAAAGTFAGLAGASTILGSSTLGSALGGIFVATTPVGWVVGSAVLAGAAGYGLTKLARSGARQDRLREEIVTRLMRRKQAMNEGSAAQSNLTDLAQLVAVALAAGTISEAQGLRMVGLVERGTLSVEVAVKRIKALAASEGRFQA